MNFSSFESIINNIMKKKIKLRNPVAKHSRNKSGAGAHKSKKDYNRKKDKKIQKPDFAHAFRTALYAILSG